MRPPHPAPTCATVCNGNTIHTRRPNHGRRQRQTGRQTPQRTLPDGIRHRRNGVLHRHHHHHPSANLHLNRAPAHNPRTRKQPAHPHPNGRTRLGTARTRRDASRSVHTPRDRAGNPAHPYPSGLSPCAFTHSRASPSIISRSASPYVVAPIDLPAAFARDSTSTVAATLSG